MTRGELLFGALVVVGLVASSCNWSSSPPAAVAQPRKVYKPRPIRLSGDLQLSATESIRSIVVPNPDHTTSVVCILYTNSELHMSTIMCPGETGDANTVRDYGPEP